MKDMPFYSLKLDFDEDLLLKMFNYFNNLEWTSDTYIIYGREVTPKRKTFMYGKSYSYSGITKKSTPYDLQIKYIVKRIEEKLDLPNGYFNGCLLNLYPDGDAGLSYHKDDEPDMDLDADIVSFSLGATRKFYLKNDKTSEVVKLNHNQGELLIMQPKTQKDWKHSIPKEKKVKTSRISLTFRKFH